MKYLDRSLQPINPKQLWLASSQRSSVLNTGRGLGYVPVGTIIGALSDVFGGIFGGSDTVQYDPVLERTWNEIHSATAALIAAHESGTLTRGEWDGATAALRAVPNAFRSFAQPLEPPSDAGRVGRDAAAMGSAIDAWIRDRATWTFANTGGTGVPTGTGGGGWGDYVPPVLSGFGGGNTVPLVVLGLGALLLLGGGKKLLR